MRMGWAKDPEGLNDAMIVWNCLCFAQSKLKGNKLQERIDRIKNRMVEDQKFGKHKYVR